jgi:hypothetical protein
VRSFLAGLILLVGAVAVPVATAGWWARETLIPADAYVATVAPLAHDKAVRSAVETALTRRTLAAVDQVPGVPEALGSRLDPVVRLAAHRVVASPSFAKVWRHANRDLHRQAVRVLAGGQRSVQVGQGATVDVRLDLTDLVRHELETLHLPAGLPLPRVEVSVPVGSVQGLHRARTGYRLVDTWGRVLPIVALALILVGLLLARRRAAALAWTAVGALVGLGALAVALLVGREAYLHATAAGFPRPAAVAAFDTVVSGLWRDIGVVALVAAVVAVASAFVARARRER